MYVLLMCSAEGCTWYARPGQVYRRTYRFEEEIVLDGPNELLAPLLPRLFMLSFPS